MILRLWSSETASFASFCGGDGDDVKDGAEENTGVGDGDDKDVEEIISAADDDAVIGVATLDIVDDHDVGESSPPDDDNADDDDFVISVATLDTIDDEDVGGSVTASDDNANANDVVIGVATFDTVDKEDVLGPVFLLSEFCGHPVSLQVNIEDMLPLSIFKTPSQQKVISVLSRLHL